MNFGRSFVAALVAAPALLAAVPAVSATVIDGSFEAQGASVGTGFCYFGGTYAAACAAGAWTGSGATGGFQYDGNTVWPGVATPAGSYYAFLQAGYGTPGAITQDVTVTAGTYSVSWLAAGRPNNGGNEGYTVTLGNNLLFTGTTTTGQAFTPTTSSLVTLAAGTYALTFTGLTSASDNTAFIDDVTLTAVPEPAAWALMVAGFGMIGFAARRRSALAA